jgi:predicted acetyltransferase
MKLKGYISVNGAKVELFNQRKVNTNGKGQKSRDKSLQRNQKIYDNAEAINKDNSQKFARKLGREEKRIEQRKKRQAKRKNRK